MKINNIIGYYDDKTNYRFVVSIRDKYFTKTIVKKYFVYRDDYLYTKEQAEENSKILATYLLEMQKKQEYPLKTYLNNMIFENNSLK